MKHGRGGGELLVLLRHIPHELGLIALELLEPADALFEDEDRGIDLVRSRSWGVGLARGQAARAFQELVGQLQYGGHESDDLAPGDWHERLRLQAIAGTQSVARIGASGACKLD